MEKLSVEYGPGYDPEKIESGGDLNMVESDLAPFQSIPVVFLSIPEYFFESSINDFAWDAVERKSVDNIASIIDDGLRRNFSMGKTLVRGIQSVRHDLRRDELIGLIIKNGSDYYRDSGATDIFATEFDEDSVKMILEGFHMFKPKCAESPQYIVDVWMVFDQNSFDNVEYLHPRHKTIANDKWRVKHPKDNGLRGILVIN